MAAGSRRPSWGESAEPHFLPGPLPWKGGGTRLCVGQGQLLQPAWEPSGDYFHTELTAGVRSRTCTDGLAPTGAPCKAALQTQRVSVEGPLSRAPQPLPDAAPGDWQPSPTFPEAGRSLSPETSPFREGQASGSKRRGAVFTAAAGPAAAPPRPPCLLLMRPVLSCPALQHPPTGS